jgi:hypothetical protein
MHGAQETRTVSTVHGNKTGKVSNKWSSYLPYYDQLFDQIKDSTIRLFEIGVQNGGSLETWASYFPNAELVLGCDIDERCGRLLFDDPRISVIVANANSPEGFGEIVQLAPFDVIVDDGSHLSEDIIISFLNYFQFVRPGGIYVIEDTHAVYMRESTNIHNRQNAFGFFKEITDLMNYEFWSRDKSPIDLFSPFLNVPLPAWVFEGWVDSIEFRNSIITIKKSTVPGHNKLGFMKVTGVVADVDAEPLKVKAALDSHGIR